MKDNEGLTVLHHAVKNGKKEIIELLISNGADINSKDNNGYTPLHYATWNNDCSTLKLLISHGADVNAFDKTDKFLFILLHGIIMKLLCLI